MGNTHRGLNPEKRRSQNQSVTCIGNYNKEPNEIIDNVNVHSSDNKLKSEANNNCCTNAKPEFLVENSLDIKNRRGGITEHKDASPLFIKSNFSQKIKSNTENICKKKDRGAVF